MKAINKQLLNRNKGFSNKTIELKKLINNINKNMKMKMKSRKDNKMKRGINNKKKNNKSNFF